MISNFTPLRSKRSLYTAAHKKIQWKGTHIVRRLSSIVKYKTVEILTTVTMFLFRIEIDDSFRWTGHVTLSCKIETRKNVLNCSQFSHKWKWAKFLHFDMRWLPSSVLILRRCSSIAWNIFARARTLSLRLKPFFSSPFSVLFASSMSPKYFSLPPFSICCRIGDLSNSPELDMSDSFAVKMPLSLLSDVRQSSADRDKGFSLSGNSVDDRKSVSKLWLRWFNGEWNLFKALE